MSTLPLARRGFLAGLLSCPVCLAAAAGPEWNYTDDGPGRWASLDPAFRVCGGGDQQSPVDLRDGVKAQLPKLNVRWNKRKLAVGNNGHTIQVDAPDQSFVEVGGERSELAQFHFHSPSEHAVDGRRASMEAHFVHQRANGPITVLAVLLNPEGANDAFSALMSVAPRQPGTKVQTPAPIDPAALLPASLDSTWRYEGSLTTPPCSQTVNWIVFDQPVLVARTDIELFRRIFPMNARPLQPLNRRYLLRG